MDLRLLSLTKPESTVSDLYSIIKEEPNILEKIDVLSFINTPLHEASAAGKINIAMELMILKPSFAKKLNADGFSPLHLAVENNQVELALHLVKCDPTLIRFPGREGMTPLHLVARNGGVDLLAKFLLACPESIRDANVNEETALHITVRNNRYEELKVLTGWMQRMRSHDALSTEIQVLNKCDSEGNTVLHVAAYKKDHQTIKQLLKCLSLNRNIQNKSGMTALDALRVNKSHMDMATEKIIQKAGGKSAGSISKYETTSVYLRKSVTFKEYCSIGMARYKTRMSDGTRNSLLVITALIISATYQTATQTEDLEKIYNLSTVKLILEIVLLWGLNTIAFLLAIVLTFILLPVGRAYMWWYISISAPLVGSYIISVYLKYMSADIFLLVYVIVIFGVLIYLLILYVKWKKTTQKEVPDPKNELISDGFKTIV